MGVIRRMTTVVTMDTCCRLDSLHVLTKDSAVTEAQLFQHFLVFIGSVRSAVAMGGGRPLSSLGELLSMAVVTAS